MKSLFLSIILIITTSLGYCQQTLSGSITHDGLNRTYIIYIPEIYSGEADVPLIINYHGYSSSANDQMWYGNFMDIADTAGFIVVQPQGTLLNGISHWNVGGWTIGSTTDDVGFTAALIDSLSAEFSIDQDRVYATGMSNGGFMSFLLACQLGDRIAAIASVTGSMTPETYNDCNPEHPTPILQMHGTTDGVVPYDGALWTKSIDEVMDYWIDYNNCNLLPAITDFPDTDPSDGSTVTKYVYGWGDNGVSTEHYKIWGGGHTWPGNAIGGSGTNNDIDASAEIWNFFSKYDINGIVGITSIENNDENVRQINTFPNPAVDHIVLDYYLANKSTVNISIYNSSGLRLKHLVFDEANGQHQRRIEMAGNASGLYYYLVEIDNKVSKGKFLISR